MQVSIVLLHVFGELLLVLVQTVTKGGEGPLACIVCAVALVRLGDAVHEHGNRVLRVTGKALLRVILRAFLQCLHFSGRQTRKDVNWCFENKKAFRP